MIPAPHRHSVVFLSIASMVLAAIATVVAWLLVRLIGLITALVFYHRVDWGFLSPAGNHLGPAVIIVPVVGGLIVGLMARFGSPAIRGHGIPEAMEQILLNRSRIAPHITILKPLSAAVSIGTGGPFGAEGPIIATGGALGSLAGQIFSTTPGERKTLLAAGAAAGMTGIFGTPVAAVLLGIELLLFEVNARSLIPISLACATASAARITFFGKGAVFAAEHLAPASPVGLFALIVIGAIVGLAAAAISRSVYWVEEQFERHPIPWIWWPAIGGVAVGVIGFYAPRTLGVGYDNIEQIINNQLPIHIVAWLCAMKFVSWAIALGSGTSGGTLAPLLTIGSGLGAVLAVGLNAAVPACHLPIGLAAVVGMAALFAGASRALLTSVVFAFETTLSPGILPALLAGSAAAYLVSSLVSRHSIMTEKIARRGVVVPHALEADAFEQVTVGAVMEKAFQSVHAEMALQELATRIGENDPAVSRRHASLVVDASGALHGIITRGDIVRAIRGQTGIVTVLDAASRRLVVAYPEESLAQAVAKMHHHRVGRLPVVQRGDERRVLGYLGRAELLEAKAARLREDGHPEPGFWERNFGRQNGRSPASV